MRFDQAMSAGMRAHRAHEPIEYPKYVDVDGKAVLALNAGHEAELLGSSEFEDDEGGPLPLPHNLLSTPEKRKPGRPRIVNLDKDE